MFPCDFDQQIATLFKSAMMFIQLKSAADLRFLNYLEQNGAINTISEKIPMKVTVKISRKEYIKLLFTVAYRRPATIAATIFKFIILLYIIFVFPEYDHSSMVPSYFVFLAIGINVSTPLRFYFIGRKIYNASRILKETIAYDLSDEKLVAKGETFTGERSWGTPYTVVELADWFLIYDSKIVFNPIPKKDMSAEEQLELKGILKNLKTVKPSQFK